MKKPGKVRLNGFWLWLGTAILLMHHPVPAAETIPNRILLSEAPVIGLPVKNLILMIPDGAGAAHMTLGRWYAHFAKGKERLASDDYVCGLIQTYDASTLVTESADAASAMAAAKKTYPGYISLFPGKMPIPGSTPIQPLPKLAPAATILEAAKSKGKSTGIAVTCRFSHATPAAFSSHYADRYQYDVLSEQQVYQNIDVVLGGGGEDLSPNTRPDGEDLFRVLKERGYRLAGNRQEMKGVTGGKVWGHFAGTYMNRHLDRNPEAEPSLAEMSQKAIEILSQNPNGFFLLIEGSHIDQAAHRNDPLGVASEYAAFDEAVQTALDFAIQDKETAVVIAPDHSTGGLTIGADPPIKDISGFIAIMKNSKATPFKTASMITENSTKEDIRKVLSSAFAVDEWTDEEISGVEQAKNDCKSLESALGKILSRRCGLSWAHGEHDGEDVPLHIFHPRHLRLQGVVDNIDIGLYLARLLDVRLKEETDRLFVPAVKVIKIKGAEVHVSTQDKQNPGLRIQKKKKVFFLPVNKDYALVNHRRVPLGGVVVCVDMSVPQAIADVNNWYIPRSALDLIP